MLALAAQRAGQREAVFSGQHDVEHDEVEGEARKFVRASPGVSARS